ncbi:MAG: N-acetylneuraminate synthase family protein [Spirochaetales bacterium]|nr:N-acetylneuraminate synthase family protein [Spirochaetales bacterium]
MEQFINLHERLESGDCPCFIIAELGTGYAQDFRYARKLIDAAKKAGADCIKVQIVFADEIVHPLSGVIPLPSGKIALYEHFKTCEKKLDYYARVKEHAEQRGLLFLCSVFGRKSLEIAKELDVCMIKVASPELNHYPLLKEIAHLNKPVILSSGVSTLDDIKKALAVITQNVALLHCVTSYPTPEDEYNLKVLPSLKALLRVPVGVSDHTLDPELIPTAAIMCGAKIVEKHFTLCKQGAALDDPIALTGVEFERMVKAIRRAEALPLEDLSLYLNQTYGRDRINAVLGDGIKRLAASEKDNYNTTRRSVLALTTIQKGEVLSAQNIAPLRSEKNLPSGLSPEFLSVICGKKASRRIPAGKGIVWDDID